MWWIDIAVIVIVGFIWSLFASSESQSKHAVLMEQKCLDEIQTKADAKLRIEPIEWSALIGGKSASISWYERD